MLKFWYTMWFVAGVLAILKSAGALAAMPWVWVLAPLWAPLALALSFNAVLLAVVLTVALVKGGGGK